MFIYKCNIHLFLFLLLLTFLLRGKFFGSLFSEHHFLGDFYMWFNDVSNGSSLE